MTLAYRPHKVKNELHPPLWDAAIRGSLALFLFLTPADDLVSYRPLLYDSLRERESNSNSFFYIFLAPFHLKEKTNLMIY